MPRRRPTQRRIRLRMKRIMNTIEHDPIAHRF